MSGVITAGTLAEVPQDFDQLDSSSLLSNLRVKESKAAVASLLEGVSLTLPPPTDLNLTTMFNSQNLPNLG